MNQLSDNSQIGLHATIVSYGIEGTTAMKLLAHSPYLQPSGSNKGTVSFVQLSESMNTATIQAVVASSDLVFILGSDDDITAPPSALSMALLCRENNIPCYAVIIASATWENTDIATQSLCNLSSNALRIPFTKPVNNLISSQILIEATLNITDLLLGKGMVGIDLDDMKTLFSHGHTAHFGTGLAAGSDRIAQAATLALDMLPEKNTAKGAIVCISAGTNFGLAEYNKAADFIASQFSDKCTMLIGTVLYQDMADEVKISLTTQ